MADEETEAEVEGEKPKKSKKGLLIGLVLALLLGGGGFYAVYSGLILGSGDTHAEAADGAVQEPLPDVTYVPIPALVVNLGEGGRERFLRFQAQLEVRPAAEEDVLSVMPRVVDVLNGYLRAVDITELEQRAALVRLRAQMLRRVQVVTGEGRVLDLLVMEFVLS